MEENLITVGQMMEHGYYLIFGSSVLNVFNRWTLDKLVVRVQMIGNMWFPLTMMLANSMALKASVSN